MATHTATTSGQWSSAGTWDAAGVPHDDGTDLVVINAGVAVEMNVVQTVGLATGNSLILTSATAGNVPGTLYWKSGTTGTLIIPAGGKIIGTNAAVKGRLLANLSGLWTGSTASATFVQSQSGTTGTVADGGGAKRIFTPGISPAWVVDALIGESMTINGTTYAIEDNDATTATLTTGPAIGATVTSWSLVVRPLPIADRAIISLLTTANVVTQYLDVILLNTEPTTKSVRTYGQIFAEAEVAADPTNTLTYTGLFAAIPNGRIVRVSAGSGALPSGLTADTDYWAVGGTGNTIKLAISYGGSAIALGAGGPINIHVGMYANWGISGNTLTKTAHGLANGTAVMVRTTGVLPTPLTVNTLYYVVSTAANAISLAIYSGGAVLTLGGSPSGVLDIYTGSTGAAPGLGGANPYTSTMMNVLDDVTGESTTWVPGAGTFASTALLNAAVLADEGPADYDQQRIAIAAITAATMTLSAAVDSIQYPNARIWLMSRNVAIWSSCVTNVAIVDATSSTGGIFGEIRSTAGTGTTFYGTGLYNSNYNTVTTISGCGYGLNGSSMRLRGTVFSNNTQDIYLNGGHIEGWGLSLQSGIQVAFYKHSSLVVPDFSEVFVGITDLCDPITHAILPGNVGWWCPGGYTKTAAWEVGAHGTPPITLTYVHVSTAEDSDRDFWVEFPILGKAGKTVTVTVYHKVTTTANWTTAPLIEICDPNKAWKAAGEVVGSSSAFSVADTNWHTDTATYAVTYDRPLTVRVRGCGGNAGGTGTGQMYWWQVIQINELTGSLPDVKYLYNAIDRGDGTTGTLRASNIHTGAGAPGVDLSAGILQTGVLVDDVTGTLAGGGGGGAPIIGLNTPIIRAT